MKGSEVFSFIFWLFFNSLCWCWLAHDVLVGFEDAKLLDPQAKVAKFGQHLLWLLNIFCA